MDKLVAAAVVPLMFLNTFGAIIAGIWLAVLGEWSAIGLGLLAMFAGGILLGLAMAPGILFAAPTAYFVEKNIKVGAWFFGALSLLYTTTIIFIWCVICLFLFLKRANPDSFFPILLWSYGAATGPIAWLAQKDSQAGNNYAMIPTFFSQIGYASAILAMLIFNAGFFVAALIIFIAMVLSGIFQIYMAFSMMRAT
jgi:hypothetical protein